MLLAGFLKDQMKISQLVGKNDYEGAIRVLEGSLTNTSEDIPSLEMIALFHSYTGQDEKAIETANKVLAFDANSFGALRLLSQEYAERDEHEIAVNYAKKGVENYPSEDQFAPPDWLFSILKLSAKCSDRFKRIEQHAKKDIAGFNKDRVDWLTWAKEYLSWYDEAYSK
jgi:tetratricopeptide (TPR) repeat protein